MMAMAMMDLKVTQMQWMMVRYTGYASNAGGRTSKGMDFSDFFLQFVNFLPTFLLFSSLKRQKNKRQRTGDGLTKHKQWNRTRRATKEARKLDSPVEHPEFKWTTTYSDEYFKAIEDINCAYRKMLSIGQAKKVFRNQVCPMMTAKTKNKFMMAKRNINDKYSNYIKTSKAVIKLRGDVHFIPDPRKYSGTPGQKYLQ